MSKETTHLTERAKKAASIVAQPANYKVCEGCDSIVKKHVSTCPNCHGYRFEDDPVVVVATAKLLGSREQRSIAAQDLL